MCQMSMIIKKKIGNEISYNNKKVLYDCNSFLFFSQCFFHFCNILFSYPSEFFVFIQKLRLKVKFLIFNFSHLMHGISIPTLLKVKIMTLRRGVVENLARKEVCMEIRLHSNLVGKRWVGVCGVRPTPYIAYI